MPDIEKRRLEKRNDYGGGKRSPRCGNMLRFPRAASTNGGLTRGIGSWHKSLNCLLV